MFEEIINWIDHLNCLEVALLKCFWKCLWKLGWLCYWV